MNSVVLTKIYKQPPFCEKEILRYAGCKQSDSEIISLLNTCVDEVQDKLIYKVCYRQLPVCVTEDGCDFGVLDLRSASLAKNLKECKSVIIFVATIGVEIDRLIVKYGRISPSKALMFQAIGAERIEALCDIFCEDIAKEMDVKLSPRFSPGYGDLSITVQKKMFTLLDCSKHIGVSLNDSLLMSPSKSVTAFVGVSNTKENQMKNKCSLCDKTDCSYRGV